MKIFITGASGYIGSQLVDSWLKDSRIEKIIALDINLPRFLFKSDNPKIHFIQKNLADVNLEEELKDFSPVDAVVHTAYFIRTPYFKKDLDYQERSNFKGAENVFDFACKNKIKKLIHFGTVASYGAKPENELSKKFEEGDQLKEDLIAYGKDKRSIEEKLREIQSRYNSETKIVVLRIGSVSGPFLQNVVKKTGLLKFFRGILPLVPITSEKSARQYVHEDDVVGAVNFLLDREIDSGILALNLAAGSYFTFREIAEILKKKPVKIPHFVAKLAFLVLWHLSLGKIPTPPGTINSYSYPIIVDGSKITKLGFNYKYTCTDALLGLKGRYKP